MDKIILVRPNASEQYNKSLSSLRACEPPLWMALLAHFYRADVLIDAEAENLTYNETAQRILSYKPNKVIIFATGSHPSAFIQQEHSASVLKSLLKKFVNEVEIMNKLPMSLTKWKVPRWDLLDMSKYRCHNWHGWGHKSRQPYGVVYTSISCPFKCRFCNIHSFYGNVFEQRLIEDVIADFDLLVQRYNIKHFKIMDELFTYNGHRCEYICDELIKRDYDLNIWAYARIDMINDNLLKKFRKAGIRWLAYGVESGNEDIRRNVLKGKFDNNKIRDIIKMTKDNGIYIVGNYMFGFWEDNYRTMQETLEFAKELNCEYSNFYCVIAYPRSKFYQEMKAKGIDMPSDYSQYAQMAKNFKPLPTKYLTSNQVLIFRDSAFNEYYNNVKYLAMMKKEFGEEVLKKINKMTKAKIKRNYD